MTITGNYEVLYEEGNAPVKAWTNGVHFDDNAKKQLLNAASMPFIHKWIAVMPDVHVGKGATIGSVIPTIGAVIPAAVGVDLGCGMMAAKTTLTATDLPDSLELMRHAIEKAVPHGMTLGKRDNGSWGEPPTDVLQKWLHLSEGFKALCDKHPWLEKSNNLKHLGTLGTGNHFIEVCLDETDSVWVMLHSGSRGVGNKIGSHFIAQAKKDMERWFINLPDKDLAYIPEGSEHFRAYVEAVGWARTLQAIRQVLPKAFSADVEAVNCHHNYIRQEHHYGKDVWVTRKGAVSARAGEMGIIPGSMGTRSYIVRGLGNEESFCSCSHGAGRVMSRTEAKRRVSLEEHAKAVAGIECRVDTDIVDETPSAYKPIEAVMQAQNDLVEIVHTLKQVLCVKG